MRLPQLSTPLAPASFGFTIIELLVATTIMILITGGGIAAYGKYQDRQQVTAAGKEFVSFLRSTQKMITAGDKGNCTGSLEDYRIQTTKDTSNYTRTINCTLLDNAPPMPPLLNQAVFNSTELIILSPLTGIPDANYLIDIYSSDSCYIYTIYFSSNGTIDDYGAIEASPPC